MNAHIIQLLTQLNYTIFDHFAAYFRLNFVLYEEYKESPIF